MYDISTIKLLGWVIIMGTNDSLISDNGVVKKSTDLFGRSVIIICYSLVAVLLVLGVLAIIS